VGTGFQPAHEAAPVLIPHRLQTCATSGGSHVT
jgi:hypothetical protein